MKNKAYIVANEEQEREVLEKLEREGLVWLYDEKPTEWSPVQETNFCHLPYALITNGHVGWLSLSQLTDEEIVFDGRKEEHMSDKYVVSQEFMNELEEWKIDTVVGVFIRDEYIGDLSEVVFGWLASDEVPDEENNNRLIAIIRWVNGEDVFEVEKPKKWVVRSKEEAIKGHYSYVSLTKNKKDNVHLYEEFNATRFNTKEEAQEWVNSHQEVIEVDE